MKKYQKIIFMCFLMSNIFVHVIQNSHFHGSCPMFKIKIYCCQCLYGYERGRNILFLTAINHVSIKYLQNSV